MPWKNKEDRQKYFRQYYQEHKDRWSGYQKTPNVKAYRKKQSERVRKLMANIKQNLGCSMCGETNPVCLIFHHINPKEKKYDVAQMNHSINLMLEEANKCIVLCQNCHAIVHYGG